MKSVNETLHEVNYKNQAEKLLVECFKVPLEGSRGPWKVSERLGVDSLG